MLRDVLRDRLLPGAVPERRPQLALRLLRLGADELDFVHVVDRLAKALGRVGREREGADRLAAIGAELRAAVEQRLLGRAFVELVVLVDHPGDQGPAGPADALRSVDT